jgi:hypothetical protein
MTTARDVVTKALQKIGAVTKNESPSSDEMSDGVSALNMMLSSWANESLSIYTLSRESFTVNANDGVYTIGPSGDFNTTRPVIVKTAYLTQNNQDYSLTIVSDEIYGSVTDKSVGGVPYMLNVDYASPISTMRLYPIPTQSYTITIYSEKAQSTISVDDTLALPPGWERALIYNLAIEIAPEYGQDVTAATFNLAKEAKSNILRAVSRARSMDANPLIYPIFSNYRYY